MMSSFGRKEPEMGYARFSAERRSLATASYCSCGDEVLSLASAFNKVGARLRLDLLETSGSTSRFSS